MSDQTNLRKRRGRTPAPPGIARSHRVVTFVKDSEFEYLRHLSEESGSPLSTIVYHLLSERLTAQKNDD